jgi:hypothetical protein
VARIPVGVFFDTEIAPKVIVDFPFERPAAKIAAAQDGKQPLPLVRVRPAGTG